MPVPDYLALCPLCRRTVGLLSNRVRAAARLKAVNAKLRLFQDEEWKDGRFPQDAAAILAKWVKAGLVIERVDGEAPEMEGHERGCVFGQKTAKTKKDILPLYLDIEQYRAKWKTIGDSRKEKLREQRRKDMNDER